MLIKDVLCRVAQTLENFNKWSRTLWWSHSRISRLATGKSQHLFVFDPFLFCSSGLGFRSGFLLSRPSAVNQLRRWWMPRQRNQRRKRSQKRLVWVWEVGNSQRFLAEKECKLDDYVAKLVREVGAFKLWQDLPGSLWRPFEKTISHSWLLIAGHQEYPSSRSDSKQSFCGGGLRRAFFYGSEWFA